MIIFKELYEELLLSISEIFADEYALMNYGNTFVVLSDNKTWNKNNNKCLKSENKIMVIWARFWNKVVVAGLQKNC